MNEDVLIAYCFGLLPAEERAAIAKDLERHPQAATFMRHTLDSLSALVLDLPPVRVPDYAKDELLGRIREQLQAAPAQASEPVTSNPIARAPVGNEPTSTTPISGGSISGGTSSSTPRERQDTQAPSAPPIPIPQTATDPAAEVDATFAVYDVTPRHRTRHPLTFVGQSIVIAGLVLVGVWWGFLRPLQQDFAIGQLLEQTSSQAGTTSYPLLTPAGDSLGVVMRTDMGELLFVLRDPPPAGQVYHVWQRRTGDTQSLGTAAARAFFVRQATETGSTILVTLEPANSPTEPSNPIASVTL